MNDLFGALDRQQTVKMAEGAYLLQGRADADMLYRLILEVSETSPFRNFTTRSGFSLSVAMTNCGELGWVSDRRGYRYESIDPEMGNPWPQMPLAFSLLAADAAEQAGYSEFKPNACLINRYRPGSKMGLHQDKDEKDFTKPIVSVSVGLPARFQFGGMDRSDPVTKYALSHGDVVVWGGPSRLYYHGIMPIKEDHHPLCGEYRYNLTFRYVG